MKTHLVFAAMTVLLLIFVINQSTTNALTFETVIDQAERLAESEHVPTKAVDSAMLRDLDYDAFRDIRWRKEFNLWRSKGLPFQTEFFFAGYNFDKPVTVYQVNRDGAGPLRFSPEFFDFGKNTIPAEDLAKGGYSGLRVHYPLNKPDVLDEVVVFLGSNYFRALGKNQQYGLSARGLGIDTAGKGKEEFPDFTTFWLVEPEPGADSMTMYALLESKSITGAYSFTVWPGEQTQVLVRAVLFPRREIAGLGIAPLTSMFWFGENTSNTFGDFRPEVHDSDGLQILRSNGEWVWRPLSWSKQIQISNFADTNPRGFGLFQRDRDYSHYQDLEANYHVRPSVWVEPVGDWGAGSVHLLQLATNNEYMDNVVAWWQPEQPLQKGSRVDVSYMLRWFSEDAGLPPIGRCFATRIDYQDAPYYRKFLLDFGGGELDGLPADAPVTADVWIGEAGMLSEVIVQKNANDNTWRVSFVASTEKLTAPIEIRCILKCDGLPLSETWTYTWMN